MTNNVKEFHNLKYIPVSDGASNKRTKATSTNFFGGWVEWSVSGNVGDGRVLFNPTNERNVDFIDSQGLIKKGIYYVEVSGIFDTTVIASETGMWRNPFNQGKILTGFDKGDTQGAGRFIHNLVVEFESDTLLRLLSSSDPNLGDYYGVFITPLSVAKEQVVATNRLSYIPSDEKTDLMRFSGLDRSERGGVVAVTPEIMDEFPWDNRRGDYLPKTGEVEHYHRGYWRNYNCIIENSILSDAPTYIQSSCVMAARGSDDSLYGMNSPILALARSKYSARMSDHTRYNPDNPTIYAFGDQFVPSFRKNVSRLVDSISGIDYWDNGTLEPAFHLPDPRYSNGSTNIWPFPSGLENWTWDIEPAAVIVTLYRPITEDDSQDILLTVTLNENEKYPVQLGYYKNSVLIPLGEDLSFKIQSKYGGALGRFYLNFTFLA